MIDEENVIPLFCPRFPIVRTFFVLVIFLAVTMLCCLDGLIPEGFLIREADSRVGRNDCRF